LSCGIHRISGREFDGEHSPVSIGRRASQRRDAGSVPGWGTAVHRPFWSDIPDIEADITSHNPAVLSTAQKITAASDANAALRERQMRKTPELWKME
jgi:hypothetical protein